MTELILDEKMRTALIHIFKTARSKIQIATFKLELFGKNVPKPVAAIAEALTEALKSGVEVEMIVNWKPSRAGVPRTNDYCANEMIIRGARVRYIATGRCAHAKFIIVDGKYAILGSHNLSVRSFISNFETSLAIDEAPIIEKLQNEFSRLFSEGKSF